MKKFVLGFASGLAGITLYIAQPGFRISEQPTRLTTEQKLEVVSALVKLSELSNIFGLERYAALFGGSAGMLGTEVGMSRTDTRYALTRAMNLTKKYGVQTGDFNPYLEASFSSALLFKDQGETEDAKRIVADALNFANEKYSNSYWIKNLEGLRKNL